nr:NAD(P)-dependent oxidoreductase [Planctomycetota bacterium]
MTTLALVSATSPEQRNALTTAYPQLHLLDCHHDRPRLAREGAEVAIVYGMVRPEELPALPKLGWIQATWAGIENLLYPAMRSREVIITNLRGQHATAMAEHAIAGLLHMLRDFPARSAAQAAGSWRCQAQVRLLADSHVLVLGTGGVGRAVIDRLLPWGARVTALNRRGDTLPGATTVTPEHLAQVLPSVDHVISTIPA